MIEFAAVAAPAQPFPGLLRHHRIRNGLTQRALADLSTVSPRAIRDLESGRANARTQTIHLLADGLRLQGAVREHFVQASLSRRPTGPFDDDLGGTAPGPGTALPGRDAEARGLTEVLELVGAVLQQLTGGHRAILRELVRSNPAATVPELARSLHRPLDEVVDGLAVLIGHGLVRVAYGEQTTDLDVPNLLRAILRRDPQGWS